jgi:hypothetical protein
MDNVIDMIANNASPSEISDGIKNMLMQKAMERIEVVRPSVVSQMFDLETETEEEE